MNLTSSHRLRPRAVPVEETECSCCVVGKPVALLQIDGRLERVCDACLADHSDLIQVPDPPTDRAALLSA